MIRLLKFLITGSWHEHEWETVHERTVNVARNGQGPVIERYGRVELRCKKCGDWKIRELK